MAKDLIVKLLDKDMKTRLGTKNGSVEVLSHDFFKGIEVDELLDKKITPPFIPALDENNVIDVSNFDEEYTNSEARESIIDDDMRKRIKEKADAYFKDFDQIVDS